MPEITLRDLFAASAMQALVPTSISIDGTAKRSYEIADAMLKARGDDQPSVPTSGRILHIAQDQPSLICPSCNRHDDLMIECGTCHVTYCNSCFPSHSKKHDLQKQLAEIAQQEAERWDGMG